MVTTLGGSWSDGPWFQYATWGSGIPTNGLTCIAMDASGRPWIGSSINGVIVRNTNGSFETYNSLNCGLPDNTIECVAFASDGALWVGTYYGGAARYLPANPTNEMAGHVAINTYPSPFDEAFYVELPATGPLHWEIIDAAGRSVAAGSLSPGDRHRIAPVNLLPGLYLLMARSANRLFTSRIIKQQGG